MVLYLVWTLLGFSLSAPPINLDVEEFDSNMDHLNTWDLNPIGLTYDYDDLDEVRGFKSGLSLTVLSSYHVVPNLYDLFFFRTSSYTLFFVNKAKGDECYSAIT